VARRTSTTIPTGADPSSAGVKATWTRTRSLRYSEMAETRTCYRHPDRETGLSCSDCGRPICTDCATFAPVGIRCPEHSGQPQGVARVATRARRAGYEGVGALVTKALIAINVGVYLINLAQGASLSQNSGELFFDGALIGQAVNLQGELVGVAEGEWWRLITACFLHGSIIHLGFNMLLLWWIGAPVEQAIGRARFLVLYLVSGLGGSAGALLLTDPNQLTVGASGAIFGILGAALVFEVQRNFVLGGSALSIIVLNLVLTFAVPNISIGGHLGGLAAGALGGLALSRFGRGHAAYGRPGVVGVAALVLVGVASVALSYWRVSGLT
jgi:membrane associated rhomboid family serine protease